MSVKLASALALLLAASAICEREKPKQRPKYEDPFALLDRHMSMALKHEHSLLPNLAHQYFWPWTELAKAVVALDDEDALEQTHVHSDPANYEIRVDVRKFRPEEIRVRVRERTVVVEGKRVAGDAERDKYVGSHFVQRYVLPAGCEPGEVTALLKPNGILVVSAPRRAPPPPPEREVPVVVEPLVTARPIEKTERPRAEPAVTIPDSEDLPMEQMPSKEAPTRSEEAPTRSEEGPTRSEEAPLSGETELLSPVTERAPAETTTYVGKIRKKELNNSTKEAKKSEPKKPIENNVLDYANVEAE